MKTWLHRVALVCLALLLSFVASVSAETKVVLPDFEVISTAGSTLTVDGDRKVLEFIHPVYDDSSPESRLATYKPFHQVYSPDGSTLLNKGLGGLYPHQRGIFYGFGTIAYDNGKKGDTWRCFHGSHQSYQGLVDGTKDVALIYWHGKDEKHGGDGKVFAHEQRSLRVIPTTVEGAQGTLLEFCSHLEPTGSEPIHLDGDTHHAGFQYRAPQEVAKSTTKQTYYLRPASDGFPGGKGKLGTTRNWNPENLKDPVSVACTNRPWTAMSFVVADQRYTVLYLDHPSNPKPSYFGERDYGRFGSYFVTSVRKDQPLQVKYRIWVQAGEMTLDMCEALSREFVQAVASKQK